MQPLTTCPETVDLYDHLEGALSLDSHLAACARCRDALASLKSALAVEAAAFAPPSELEVERALKNVRARGQTRGRRPWGQTALAFAAASLLLALLLPSTLETPDCSRTPGGAGGMATTIKPPGQVSAPPSFGKDGNLSEILSVSSTTSGVGSVGSSIHSGH